MLQHLSLIKLGCNNVLHILKFDKFKPNFKTLNDFKCKSDEYKSCSTHQYLQLLFRLSYHLTKFEPFKF